MHTIDRLGPDRLAVADGVDQLVVLLTRLSPRNGLSLVAASTLSVLARGGPMRLTDLADAAAVTQPSMTGLVGRLVAQGLVRRTPDDQDRRSVKIAVTDAGRDLLAARRVRRAETLAGLIDTLDAAERAALAAAVPAITALVREGTSS